MELILLWIEYTWSVDVTWSMAWTICLAVRVMSFVSDGGILILCLKLIVHIGLLVSLLLRCLGCVPC